MPSLLSFFTICDALGLHRHDDQRLVLVRPAPSPVLASRHIQSACAPLVVHILPPLIT